MHIYSIDAYLNLGFSLEEAQEKVNTNLKNTSDGIKRGLLLKRFKKCNFEDLSLEEFSEMEKIFLEKYRLSSNKLFDLIKSLKIRFNLPTKNILIKLSGVLDKVSGKNKKPLASELYYVLMYGIDSDEYKAFKKLRKELYSTCGSFEKHAEKFDTEEEARKEYKIKYGSLNIEHIMRKHNCDAETARKYQKEQIDKGHATYNKKSKEEKQLIDKSKAHTLENYIKKHGSVLGALKYAERLEAKQGVTSKKYYIEKYGEEIGLEKFIHEKVHNTHWRPEYWVKQGYSEDQAKIKVQEVFDGRPSFNKKYCIEKYGKERGLIIWQNRQILWQKTLNNKPQEQIDLINKSKAVTVQNYIKKYGEKEGLRLFEEHIERRNNNFNTKKYSSKEANKFLLRLYKILRKIGIIDKKEAFFDVRGSRERFIYSKENKQIFFYDFCIEKMKCIIEYHGVAFHPKEGNYSWVSAYGNNYENSFNRDQIKKKVAIDAGYKFYEIWSDVNHEESLITITNNILELYEEQNI